MMLRRIMSMIAMAAMAVGLYGCTWDKDEPDSCAPKKPPVSFSKSYAISKAAVDALPPLDVSGLKRDTSDVFWPAEDRMRGIVLTPMSDTGSTTRPMPDFSDEGVSTLFTRAGGEDPSTLIGCSAAAVFAYITDPVSEFMYGPQVYSTAPLSCADTSWRSYMTSSNQRDAWAATDLSVKESFVHALVGYKDWLAAGYSGPLYVSGLNFGGTNNNRFTMVFSFIGGTDGHLRYNVIVYQLGTFTAAPVPPVPPM